MLELPFDYWNKLASQLIVISSLLGGFSLSLIFTFNKDGERNSKYLFRASTVASASFLVSILAMTKILMMTTVGFPYKIANNNLTFPRIIGTISFFIGCIAIISVIMLSGWNKNNPSKVFTTIIGALTFLLFVLMLM